MRGRGLCRCEGALGRRPVAPAPPPPPPFWYVSPNKKTTYNEGAATDAPHLRISAHDLPEFVVASRGALPVVVRALPRAAKATSEPAWAVVGGPLHAALQEPDGAVTHLEIAPPKSDNTFRLNDTIRVTVTFDRPVMATKRAWLALTLDDATQYALYHSGARTTSLVFAYVVQPGDADPNGISIATDALTGEIFLYDGDDTIVRPTLGVFAVTKDSRYKVNTTHETPSVTCDIAEDNAELVREEDNAESVRKEICALQLVVAAFWKDRTADREARRNKGLKTDTLNAKCEKGDSAMSLNDKDVQKALRRLNLGRQMYCDKIIRQVVVVNDFLIKAHRKYKKLDKDSRARQKSRRKSAPSPINDDRKSFFSTYEKPDQDSRARRKSAQSAQAQSARIAAIGDDLEALLRDEGLYKVFKAYARGSILSYASISGSGDDADASREIEIIWRTRLLGNNAFVFFGDLGYGPLFATSSSMARKEDANCHCEESRRIENIVQIDEGMYYNVGIRWYPLPHRIAVSLSGGQTQHQTDSLHIQESDRTDSLHIQESDRIVTLNNRKNNQFDLGMAFQLYDVDDWSAINYIEQRPLLDSQFGVRTDSRYGYQFRGYWRIAIDFREIFGFLAKSNTTDRLLSAVVVVEGELDFRMHSKWPSTTKVLFLGDTRIDVFSHLFGR